MTSARAPSPLAEGPNEGIFEAHALGAPADAAAGDLFGLELAAFEGATVAPPKRGPGRPPGSPNRTTLQLQRLLMAKGYRDPAEFLAAIVSMSTDELAKALSCEKLDAMGHQLRAAGELMPYFHQKMPTAVEVKHEAPRQLIVIGDVVNTNVLQDQALSARTIEGSHGNGSHDDR